VFQKKLTPFCNIISAPLNSLFDTILFVKDRAGKSLLDRDIFIFKTLHRNWRQTINSLNIKCVLGRYTLAGNQK
jgi:hypothetical protein